MTNLEYYLMLERVWVDMKQHHLSDPKYQKLFNALEDASTEAWYMLTEAELEYTWNRGMIVGPEVMDTIPLPAGMLWGALNQPRLQA